MEIKSARFAQIFSMCNYHTWFHDSKSGYVTECMYCNKIQVCFGNLLLSFNTNEFESFRKYLEKNVEAMIPSKDKNIKSVLLTTACKATSMILSETELEGLHYMIEYADTEMKAVAFIKMFNVIE